VELEALEANKAHDSRRASAVDVEEVWQHTHVKPAGAPVGTHPLRAHPVRPSMDRSMSGSYYSAQAGTTRETSRG